MHLETPPDSPTAEGKSPEYRADLRTERRHDYLVHIFVYNERAHLETFLHRFARPQERLYDIMLGDDGSTDGSITPELFERFEIRGVTKLPRNHGLSANIKAALDWYRDQDYTAVTFINGNNRDNPEAIPKFIEAFQEGCDYVQGSRFRQGGAAINTPWIRYLAVRLVHAPLFSLAAGQWMTDTTNGYRGYSMKFLESEKIHPFQDAFVKYEIEQYLSARAIQLGFRAKEVPVVRAYAKGNYSSHIRPGYGWWLMLKPLIMLLFGRYK